MNQEEKEEKELWQKVASETGEEKVDALTQLSYRAFSKGDYEECLALCETARDEYEALGAEGSTSTLAHIYFGIACSNSRLSKHKEAIAAAKKCTSLYKSIGSSKFIDSLGMEGDLHFELKDYQKAYETYQLMAMEGGVEITDENLAYSYDNSARALAQLEKWDQALGNYLKAAEVYKKNKQVLMMAHCYEEISLCFSHLENGVEAEAYATMVLDIAITAEHDFHLMWGKARRGLALKVMNQFDEALDLLMEAKSAMVRMDSVDWKSVLEIENQIMEIYIIQGRADKALALKRRIGTLEDIVLDDDEEI